MRNRRLTDYSNYGNFLDDALNDAIARISATFIISTSIHTIAKTVLDCAMDITESEYGIVSFYDGEECCIFCNDFKINKISERVLSRNILSVPAEMGNEKLGQIVLFNSTREYSHYDMKVVKQLSELLALAVNRKVAEENINSFSSII